MSKLIINKHYRNASSVTENSFTKQKDYNQDNQELFREGEIVISNEEDNPGLYIFTAGKNDTGFTGQGGKVINVTSPENIRLTSGYTTATTEENPTVSSGDTIQSAIGKIGKIINNQSTRIDDAYNMAEMAITGTVEEVNAIRVELSAETSARTVADANLANAISSNTEAIETISGATSRDSMDEFITENIEGGYYPGTREIKLTYKRGDGTTVENLMVVDVTEFATQIDFLQTAYTYTVSAETGETHDSVTFDKNDEALVLVFIVSDGGGAQREETVYFNVTRMIGVHQVLTEDEYEALSVEDKNNGFFYYTYEEE